MTDSESGWKQARKKPVTIDYRGPYYETGTVETLEGMFEIDEEYLDTHDGWVLIRGVNGEVYPCALDVFEQTYDRVERDTE